MDVMRLQKFLSQAGVASRRAAEELIRSGKVSVNGTSATIGQVVNPATDRVLVDGKQIQSQAERIYLVLNKPVGYTTTRQDPYAHKTVFDLLPAELRQKVWPVGRLDRDSCGLLIFTNDGELTQQLTHPRYDSEKEYLVQYTGTLTPQNLQTLQRGVNLEDGRTKPCRVKIKKPGELSITLGEGRKRQIRRMVAAVGCRVTFLQRIREEKVRLGTLPTGQWRRMTKPA